MTLTPVTTSILLGWSQIDAKSLIQVERGEKARRRIQEKIMRTRSTLEGRFSTANGAGLFNADVMFIYTFMPNDIKRKWSDA